MINKNWSYQNWFNTMQVKKKSISRIIKYMNTKKQMYGIRPSFAFSLSSELCVFV